MIDETADLILERRRATPAARSLLVALSGIDASGKGFLAGRLHTALARRCVRAGVLTVDGWLNPPALRFGGEHAAERFYEQAIRFEDMFRDLVLPLRRARSIRVEVNQITETAAAHHRHVFAFDDVDVILLEGIFLLKRAYRAHYDLALWVECSFETALARAVERAQEGLAPEDTVRAYETIYFPAQRLHFARDAPRSAAARILVNDPRRLAGGG